MPHSQFLPQIVLILCAALVVAWLFRILRAPSIIGFLVTGLLLGPSGFSLIPHEDVSVLAELGLVLLLFTVGLELSPEPLIRTGRRLVLAGGLQLIVTTGVMASVIHYGGTLSTVQAATIGVAIALSSTAIVLKQLADLRQTDSPAGSIIVGVLLLQDVAVILVMLLMPMWTGSAAGGWTASVWRGVWSVGGLAAVTILARTVLPYVLKWIVGAGGREFVTLLAVLMACLGAYLAGLAGWSWALGACIAGLLLAETDLRHQLFADILPFRDVFNALFFISMGMLVDLPAVANHLALLVVAVAAFVVLKMFIGAGAVVAAGWPLRIGIQVGMGICTVSEFAYVLLREAGQRELVPQHIVQFMNAAIVGTMLIGTMLVPISSVVAEAVARRVRFRRGQGASETEKCPEGHVIIVGFGLNGHNLARVLAATGVRFRIIEMNRHLAAEARRAGYEVIVGDAAQMPNLMHAGLHGARALVIAIDDKQATRRVIAQAHGARADLFVLARTRYVAEVDELYRLGASQVIPEEFETSIEMFAHLLKELHVPDNVVEAQIAMVRTGRYGMLRGMPSTAVQRRELLEILDVTATQTFLLAAASPAAGKTIRQIDLRARTGATIIAVVRQGKALPNPTAETRLEAGDVLVLVGSHQQLDQAKAAMAAPMTA